MRRLEWVGHVVPKKRPRVTRYKTYMPKQYVDYKKDVEAAWVKKHYLHLSNRILRADIVFYMPIPKSASKRLRSQLEGQYCMKLNGDIDNLIGGVMDALNEVAFHDDHQIVECSARKLYEDKNHKPGFILELTEL